MVQAALVTLAGQAAAEALCLPFSAEGFAQGQLDDRHLGMLHPLHGTAATRAGAHVKQVEPGVMHVLVAARCFTDDAVAYLDQWVRSRASLWEELSLFPGFSRERGEEVPSRWE